MRLLDSTDMSVNADQPLLQGLTNAGPANMGIPMNLPAYQPQTSPNVGVFGTPPPLIQSLEIEDEDEFNDTDPMSFEDNQIFENSAFLGIRIGKKAKARGQAKRIARVQKRLARKAEKSANQETIANSPWSQPNEVNPQNYSPMGVAPQATTDVPPMLAVVNDDDNNLSAQKLGIASAQDDYNFDVNSGYTPDDTTPVNPAKKNTWLDVGIGVAVIALVFYLKNKK